jgi:hypothetical protein
MFGGKFQPKVEQSIREDSFSSKCSELDLPLGGMKKFLPVITCTLPPLPLNHFYEAFSFLRLVLEWTFSNLGHVNCIKRSVFMDTFVIRDLSL